MHMRANGVGKRGKRREATGHRGARTRPRKPTGAGASEHRPAGLSLRTKKCRQTGRLVAFCPPIGCATERTRQKPFNLFARLDARSCGNVAYGFKKKEKETKELARSRWEQGVDRYLSFAYSLNIAAERLLVIASIKIPVLYKIYQKRSYVCIIWRQQKLNNFAYFTTQNKF